MNAIKTLTITSLGFATLTACGIKKSYTVKGHLDNQSDYPAVLILDLDETSVEDSCKPYSQNKRIDVAPHSEESGEISISCEYEPSHKVSFELNRGIEEGKPAAKVIAFNFGSYRSQPMQAGEQVFWLDANDEVQTVTIGSQPYYEASADVALPDTAALLSDPVRTDGQILQMFFPGDDPQAAVIGLGVDVATFKTPCTDDYTSNCYHLTERDGAYFVHQSGQPVTGALRGGKSTSDTAITCTNDGCTF